MASHFATVSWINSGPDFLNNEYSRAHQWAFDGGSVINASAAPDIVPPPWSKAENVDPEEAFVASISSCHMLFFIHIASQKGFILESYKDKAEGFMEKNTAGQLAIPRVILRPESVFCGVDVPDKEMITSMHHSAHRSCFIANSVNTQIDIEIPGT
jgi:organic hydroperoxide reductase OsmC/OhrA